MSSVLYTVWVAFAWGLVGFAAGIGFGLGVGYALQLALPPAE